MIGLELAGEAIRGFPTGYGTHAYPEAHANALILSADVDGEAGGAELAGEPRRSIPVAEGTDLDREAALRRRRHRDRRWLRRSAALVGSLPC